MMKSPLRNTRLWLPSVASRATLLTGMVGTDGRYIQHAPNAQLRRLSVLTADDLGYADDGEEHFSEEEYDDQDEIEEGGEIPPSKSAAASAPNPKTRPVGALMGKAAKLPVPAAQVVDTEQEKRILAEKMARQNSMYCLMLSALQTSRGAPSPRM